MQRTVFIITIAIMTVIVSACNLGAEPAAPDSEVIEQPTIVVQAPTNTPQPSVTPLPTQDEVERDPVVVSDTCNPRTDWATYTVIGGDTLSRIAVRGSTTVDTLITGNCLANPNLIAPGQVLRVPFAVLPPTQVVVTSTPAPIQTTHCRITMSQDRSAYADQRYFEYGARLDVGQTYAITGQNQWSYRIQYTNAQEVWLQKSISEQPQGDCANIFEVGLAYREGGATRYNICYFVPTVDNITAYADQQQAIASHNIAGNSIYTVDAFAGNQYRVVTGLDLSMPGWIPASSGRLEGNCNDLLDMATSTTLNGARSTYQDAFRGFTFEYPSNWNIQQMMDGFGGLRTGTMPTINGYPTAFGFPDDLVDVFVSYMDSGSFETPLEFATRITDDITANPSRVGIIEAPQVITLPSGMEAVYYVLSRPQAPSYQYVFAIDGELTLLTLHGNPELAQSIVDSIRQS